MKKADLLIIYYIKYYIFIMWLLDSCAGLAV